MKGFDPDFLGGAFRVSLPTFSSDEQKKFAKLKGGDEYVLDYINYSLIIDRERRFPVFTASNISGEKFEHIKRKDLFNGSSDKWNMDSRIENEHQWGIDLYKADKSDFDRGHMVKREDVQWGENADDAARSTFFYTNAVPQHARVNQVVWRRIEDYILKKESVKNGYKINVFTGPILDVDDPVFVTEVNGQQVLLPTLFWKIVYYISTSGELNRVGFLVGQKYLLQRDKIIKRLYKEDSKRGQFMNFKDADTYQVDIKTIEELSQCNFAEANDPFTEERPSKLVVEAVEVKRGERNSIEEEKDELSIKGLYL